MRNRILITFLLLLSLGLSSMAHANEPTSVYDAIQGGNGELRVEQPVTEGTGTTLDGNVSIFPFLFKLIVSLAFIIVLIYMLLRFWANKTRAIQSRGPFTLLGGVPLGPNRSLQVVVLGRTMYVLGVGENVQLLRMLTPGDEYEEIMEGFEEASLSALNVKQWLNPKEEKEKSQQNWEEILQGKFKDLQVWDDQEDKRRP